MDAALANTPAVGFSSASTGPQSSTPGNGGSTNASDNSGDVGAATETNASVESPTPSVQEPSVQAPSVQEPSVSQAAPVQPPAQATPPAEQLPATEQTPRRTQATSQNLAPDDETGR